MKTPEELAEEYRDWLLQSGGGVNVFDTFLAGYQAAKEQVADVTKVMNSSNGWISVEDRLPELNRQVIIALPFVFEDEFGPTNERGCGVEIGRLLHDGQGAKWSVHVEDKWITEVTHWMPLPEPPKEE